MSVVRYVNKETGAVSLYESTSRYDPVKKQSRPIRKYLGREDPVTGELIPSSGKRGRKKGSGKSAADGPGEGPNYQALYAEMAGECRENAAEAERLREENKRLKEGLEKLEALAAETLRQA